MIYIGADAKTQTQRRLIINYLSSKKYEYLDLGVLSADSDLDVTVICSNVAKAILQDDHSTGVVVCGAGVGTSIVMNRFVGIRAVLATDPDLAEWGKMYDNCNVLCMAGWKIKNQEQADVILDAWFTSQFEALPRRLRRVEKMDNLGR